MVTKEYIIDLTKDNVWEQINEVGKKNNNKSWFKRIISWF